MTNCGVMICGTAVDNGSVFEHMASFEFGEKTVYAEPSWYQFWESPYYQPKHKAFRAKLRAFVDAELNPHVDEWEEKHVENPNGFEMPVKEFLQKAHKLGLYSPMWPKEYGGTPPEGGWDAFMDLVWIDEIGRCSSAGVKSAFSIVTMALPLLLHFGSKDLIQQVAPGVVSGEKIIGLCISEPSAGSDVAALKATAQRTPDGKGWILNGQKKWITLGIFADYYVVAARTGSEGPKGLSLFLVDRASKGVVARRMKLQGHWLSGTALIAFDNVFVPNERLLGKENEGFRGIMHNFNHERYLIAVQANRGSRELLAQCMAYASKRRTFGKTLLEHQVIRQKMADMAMRIEAVHALIETITYQVERGLTNDKLGGTMALLKVMSTRTLEVCVREASQVFGGASYVRSGVGVRVERAGRELRGCIIPGGSDEILADLAVRQALMMTMRARMEDGSAAKL
jgi:alkylation response protein AidB-like acyl-CoA dehydrogenase